MLGRTSLVLALLLLPTAIAAPHTESGRYTGGVGIGTCASGVNTVNSGAVCFRIGLTDTTVGVSVDDDVNGDTLATYQFLSSNGVALLAGPFCTSIDLTIPSGARTLRVILQPSPPAGTCAAGVPTVGTVTAEFA